MLACCGKVDPELALRAFELVAEFAKDSNQFVRLAAREALPACYDETGLKFATRAFELVVELAEVSDTLP